MSVAHKRLAPAARWIRCMCLAALLAPAAPGAIAQQAGLLQSGSRVALVIGNSAYPTAPLRNPVADAGAVADALTRLGFRVSLRSNLDLSQMLDALTRFARDTRNDDVRVFFYAGHALQSHGENYLLPVDARIGEPDDIPLMAAEVQQLIDHLERSNKGVNIVMLDACRTYPLPPKFRPGTRGTRPVLPSSGLAEVEAPRGTVIAFSTAPGSVAQDGPAQHSVYVKYVLANIELPGLSLEELFKRVRAGVSRETQQAQMPWESSSLVGDFCFRPGPRGECPAPPAALPAAQASGR